MTGIGEPFYFVIVLQPVWLFGEDDKGTTAPHLRGGKGALIGRVGGERRILGKEDGRQPYKREDLRNMGGEIAYGKRVTRLDGVRIERDESGNTGGIDPFDLAEIERNTLARDQGSDERDKSLLGAAHELGNAGRLDQKHLIVLAA